MANIHISNVRRIYFKGRSIRYLWFNGKIVWQRWKDEIFEIDKITIHLNLSNSYTEIVTITSNVEWTIITD